MLKLFLILFPLNILQGISLKYQNPLSPQMISILSTLPSCHIRFDYVEHTFGDLEQTYLEIFTSSQKYTLIILLEPDNQQRFPSKRAKLLTKRIQMIPKFITLSIRMLFTDPSYKGWTRVPGRDEILFHGSVEPFAVFYISGKDRVMPLSFKEQPKPIVLAATALKLYLICPICETGVILNTLEHLGKTWQQVQRRLSKVIEVTTWTRHKWLIADQCDFSKNRY